MAPATRRARTSCRRATDPRSPRTGSGSCPTASGRAAAGPASGQAPCRGCRAPADNFTHEGPPRLVKIVVAHGARAPPRVRLELNVPLDRAEDQRRRRRVRRGHAKELILAGFDRRRVERHFQGALEFLWRFARGHQPPIKMRGVSCFLTTTQDRVSPELTINERTRKASPKVMVSRSRPSSCKRPMLAF